MKMIRIFKVFFIILAMIVVFSNSCIAMDVASLLEDPSLATIQKGISGASKNTGITGAINTIIGLIQLAGTGISIIMITMLGIKYIIASVEEKAEIKKTALPIVIGSVLLFGAVNIITVVEKFGGIINSSQL